MRPKILSYCALIALFLLPKIAFAMHIIGGEITYEYLGEGDSNKKKYRFTMKIYRDCQGAGAPLDPNAPIAIYKGTLNANVLLESFKVGLTNREDLTAAPPPCVSNVPNVCVEQGTYVFERQLPLLTNPNESYFIVYQRCCRNTTINNIISPGDIGATYMVEVTQPAMQNNNSSPVYSNFPPIIICNNFPLVFNHSATDKDGDQLFYELCSPWGGGGPILNDPGLYTCDGAQPTPPCAPPFDNVPFIVPDYTPSQPMGGNPAVTINGTTGLITGTPNMLGQFVVGVCVKEYRGSTLLSTVKRDFQFNVADCVPDVFANIAYDSISGPKQYVKRSCGPRTITFENKSVEPSKITSYSWEFDLNGTPYQNSTMWNATVPFPDTGVYYGKLILNPGAPCNDTAFITALIYPEIIVDFEYDYDTCIAGPVIFTDKSTGEGIVNRWNWNFDVPNGNATDQNPTFQFPYPGNHGVVLTAYDKNRCKGSVEKTIAWYPAPPVLIVKPDSYLGCSPAKIFFDNKSTPLDSTYFIVWDYGDGKQDTGIISPTHEYLMDGDYTVSLLVTSPLGCFIGDTFPSLIRVRQGPTAAFECDPDTLLSNLNNTVQFIDKSLNTDFWNWNFGGLETTNEQNPTFTFPDTGFFKVLLTATHQSGCKDTVSKILNIMPEIRWFMPNAFTPNGDGQNDTFYGKGAIEGVRSFSMTIWNRWGELVFETNDPTAQWNGKVNNTGGVSPAGVYVYLVTMESARGERLEYRGFSTLVK